MDIFFVIYKIYHDFLSKAILFLCGLCVLKRTMFSGDRKIHACHSPLSSGFFNHFRYKTFAPQIKSMYY